MITLEFDVIPDTRIIMRLNEDGKTIGECKDLPLARLQLGTASMNVPREGKVFLEIVIQVARTKENKIASIEATVKLSVTKPKQYIPEVTEIFKGAVDGQMSIKII